MATTTTALSKTAYLKVVDATQQGLLSNSCANIIEIYFDSSLPAASAVGHIIMPYAGYDFTLSAHPTLNTYAKIPAIASQPSGSVTVTIGW